MNIKCISSAIIFPGGALVNPQFPHLCTGDTEKSETDKERAVNRESAVYNGARSRTQPDLSGKTNLLLHCACLASMNKFTGISSEMSTRFPHTFSNSLLEHFMLIFQRSDILAHIWTGQDVWPPHACREFIVETASILEMKVRQRNLLNFTLKEIQHTTGILLVQHNNKTQEQIISYVSCPVLSCKLHQD